MKHLKKFTTELNYLAVKDLLETPAVSLSLDKKLIHYDLDNDRENIKIVYSAGSGSMHIMTKQINAFGQTYTINQSGIEKMTLDEQEITFEDFDVVNVGIYGLTCEMYDYTFSNVAGHVLKIWLSPGSSLPRFSPWSSGPTPPPNAACSILSVELYNITEIPDFAFWMCDLMEITIPSSTVSIGTKAFSIATSTGYNMTITSYATTAPAIKPDTFSRDYRHQSDGTLYVPINSTGYDVWVSSDQYYLNYSTNDNSNWTKVEFEY